MRVERPPRGPAERDPPIRWPRAAGPPRRRPAHRLAPGCESLRHLPALRRSYSVAVRPAADARRRDPPGVSRVPRPVPGRPDPVAPAHNPAKLHRRRREPDRAARHPARRTIDTSDRPVSLWTHRHVTAPAACNAHQTARRAPHSRPADKFIGCGSQVNAIAPATSDPPLENHASLPASCRPRSSPLPLSPGDSIPVNPSLSILRVDGSLIYFHGLLPVHSHPADSPRDRDRVISLLVSLGTATAAQLARALGLSARTVSRAVQARAAHAEAAFSQPPKTRSRSALQGDGQLQQAADLLRDGHSYRQVASALDVSHQTVFRFHKQGLLPPPSDSGPAPAADPPLPKAERNRLDAAAPLGRAALDAPARV